MCRWTAPRCVVICYNAHTHFCPSTNYMTVPSFTFVAAQMYSREISDLFLCPALAHFAITLSLYKRRKKINGSQRFTLRCGERQRAIQTLSTDECEEVPLTAITCDATCGGALRSITKRSNQSTQCLSATRVPSPPCH